VANWVLKKPSPEQRIGIEDSVNRCVKAVPFMLAGDMPKATQIVHTHKAERPKPAPKPAPKPELKTPEAGQ
jgi:PTH1 family peptidyl-tRNA hydrolase